jgi:hypothetical protein
MNLYYANGGGLGHLTRAKAFLHQLGIGKEIAILTSSKSAKDKRIVGDLKIIAISENFAQNKEDYRDFLQKVFIENQIKKIFLDSFPAGILGEFADFNFGETEVFYIARLLRWKNYSQFLTNKTPHFKKTFVLENLENEHQKFIENYSEKIENIELIYPNFETQDEKIAQKIIREKTPFWLIVHAGNDAETLELLNYAKEMRELEKAKVDLILITPNENSYKNSFDIYPAARLFPFAERIFTACGFNVFQQAKNFRHKHFFLPFERRFDDQFQRAKLINKLREENS